MTTKITRILAVPAVGAYYYEDLAALQEQSIPLSERYTAPAVTPGFHRVREVAEAVSVGLVLEGGSVAWGDCVAVAYSGKAGRDPVFRTADGLSTIRNKVAPLLEGRELTSFRELAAEVDGLTEETRTRAPKPSPSERPESAEGEGLSRRDLLTAPFRFLHPDEAEGEPPEAERKARLAYVTVERPLHSAVRYGASQALLSAVALSRGLTMAEVIAEEWGLPQPARPVPIHAQSGPERRRNADKMIVRRVDSLPHALVDDVPRQMGEDGEELVRYVRWLKGRIRELGGPDYDPVIHLDVHGALGRIYGDDPSTSSGHRPSAGSGHRPSTSPGHGPSAGSGRGLGRMLGYLYRLESSVQPSTLRLESPMIMNSRAAQIETMRTLREYVQFRNMAVEIVADEWANTLDDVRAFVEAQAVDMIQIKMPDLGSIHNAVDAVLTCKEGGVGAFLGGSCAETDLSARTSVHVALATRPDMLMAKPGMGVDEAISIVQNEMTRTLVWIKTRG